VENLRSELDSDTLVRIGYESSPGLWGWGLAGWWYDGADGDMGTRLNSDPSNGIRTVLRTEALLPEVVAPDLGAGVLALRATNHFETWSLELNGIRELAGADGGRFFMTAGLRLSAYRDSRVETLLVAENGSSSTSQHFGELEASILAGPALGLHGRARLRKHRFEGSLTQAIVFGDFDLRAVYTERQDGALVLQSIWDDNGDSAVPITEIDLRWMYDVTRRVSLGAGFFGSIWWDAPVAPIGNTPVGPARTLESTFIVSGPMVTLVWRSIAR
jgi:hypothetical protein